MAEWDTYASWCYGIIIVSRGVMRSAASSYAAMHMVAGSRPVFVIAWEWHIGLALLCGCSGALEYPTTNSYRPINKSLSLILILIILHVLWNQQAPHTYMVFDQFVVLIWNSGKQLPISTTSLVSVFLKLAFSLFLVVVVVNKHSFYATR